ncbi:mediator of RNA polymerase II transcription subunit 6 [Selaginella moellendorffii]|uniref:mediator of RNA polymerase II transcription subunit 6 n=1 Tax=Selaginella moellendorffii TaxID=88036 RepID=UPI000D1CE434|nr:mediator of RNA polymerase II transcription subunit 6 [Selaginella moellendorffii]|eukprot:XP_024520555.1 mediator of RNA polymerase II transcription subunit 6 [Selaginella moellendorffii]
MRSVHPLDMTQLLKMTGVEYVLLEAQEPNLFVLRKQKCESGLLYPRQPYLSTTLLYSVVCSRVARAVHHVSTAFSQRMTMRMNTRAIPLAVSISRKSSGSIRYWEMFFASFLRLLLLCK